MEKKKKWIILGSVVLLCVAVGVSSLIFALTRGKQKDKEPDPGNVVEGPNVDVKAAVAEGRFPAGVLYSIGKPLYNNDLTDSSPVQELQDTGVRYTFDATNVLKSAYVEGIEMEAARYDTMTIRLRSLTQDAFTRFRLYLLTDQGGNLLKKQVVDTAGNNANLITVGEPDADGWITVRITVKGLEEWTSAKTIKGFNFGWMNKGADQEVGEITFTWENAQVDQGVTYDWEDGYFPAEVLQEIAVPVYSNKEDTTAKIRVDLLSTGLKYSYNQLWITGLKSMWVQDLNLDTKKFDTMTVKLRSRDLEAYSRWRLYLVSDQEGDLKSDQVADSQNTPGLFEASEPDEDGWVVVNVDLTKIFRWNSANTIKAFNFGFVNAGPNHEFAYVKFHKSGKSSSSTRKPVTDGQFPAKVLYAQGYPVYNKNVATTRFVGETLQNTGVKYTWGSSHTTGLKSVYADNLQLDTEQFNTMTIRLRTLDKGEFTLYRLYLLTDTAGDLSDDKLGVVVNSKETGKNVTVSEPDAQGWITVKIDLGNIELWKNSRTALGFNFGWVNTGFVQEIGDIRFTMETIPEQPVPEKPQKPEPVLVTDGQFPAGILYANGRPLWNNDAASTDQLSEELLAAGVKYDFTGFRETSKKCIYVEHMELAPEDYDTMTVRVRSLDGTAFERYCLYILGTNGGSLGNKTQGMAADSVELNQAAITVSEADAEGWITVKYDLSRLELWKNAGTVKGFSFTYVNKGARQELAEIRFTKEKQSEDPKPDDPKPEPVLVKDGQFPAEILYSNGRPLWNNDAASTEQLDEELLATGVKYDFTGFRETSKKCIYVEHMELAPEDYDTMTVRVRSLDGTAFERYCLYILGTNGGSLGNKTQGMAADSVELNQAAITVSEADAEGWITVKYDLSRLELWKNAGTVKGFSFTYVNKGARQELAEIRFTKERQPDPGPDDPKPELTEEEKQQIAAGVFDAKVLYAAGRPVWNNNVQDAKSRQELADDRVTYTFQEGLALKSIYVNGVEMNPKEFEKMVIRIRSLTEDTFERFRLYLVTNEGGSLTKEPILDTGKNLNSDSITVGQADKDGWMDVTIDLDGLESWIQAETVTGFNLGYVNEGSDQEVASILFSKKSGSFTGSFGAAALYELGRPVQDNKSGSTASLKEELLATGVKYDFTGDVRNTALKSVVLENIALDTKAYDTMTVKIRALDENSFDRWRLYLLTDQGGSLFTQATGMVLDSNGLNKELVTVSQPDDQGWITVTIDVGSIDLWKKGSTVTGVNFGYVNKGNLQEVAEISFTKTQVSLVSRIVRLLGSFGIIGRISPAILPKYLLF